MEGRYGVNVVSTAAIKLGKMCVVVLRNNKLVIDKKQTDICFVILTNLLIVMRA